MSNYNINQSRRSFLAAGLVLVSAAPISVLAFEAQAANGVVLPNGYETHGSKYESWNYRGRFNISSSEKDLVEKSRLEGIIKDIGILESRERGPIKIEQHARGGGGLVGGNAQNFAEVPDDYVFIKLELPPGHPSGFSDYKLIIAKRRKSDLPPATALHMFDIGARISIPTLRQYDYPEGIYRVLKNPDEFSIGEIRKITE